MARPTADQTRALADRIDVFVRRWYPKANQLSRGSSYRPYEEDGGTWSHHNGQYYNGSNTAAIDYSENDSVVGSWYSGATNASAAAMRDFAKWWFDNFGDITVQEFHTTPYNTDNGFNIANQVKNVGDVDGHDSHVHLAMSSALMNSADSRASQRWGSAATPVPTTGSTPTVEYAPAAIKWLFAEWKKAAPSAQLSGIVGDSAHTFGYHRARNVLGGGDSSVQQADDRAGDGWAASAIDVTMSDSDMRLVTGRFNRAFQARDPRMAYVAEVGGTLDSNNTYTMYVYSGGTGAWDSTHLWHVHVSIRRRYATSMDAMKAILSIVKGETVEQWRAGGGTGSTTTNTEDDDMPAVLPLDLPLVAGEVYSHTINPVEDGGLPWGAAYLNILLDLYGGKLKLRIVGTTSTGTVYAIGSGTDGVQTIESNKQFSIQLKKGTRAVSFQRLDAGADDVKVKAPFVKKMTACIEIGRR